ncbi:hypothetical protein CFO_g5142 [Ceratocystis platani]|uniref:Methyltransferase n=1 Tax=Ceratocystis fimbriata f. sp. platani TaxID=88771 RepID=A0A0F8D8P9_CERFI|nr:hypothetical protein CFO_g5142 [Ceratocystis platani]
MAAISTVPTPAPTSSASQIPRGDVHATLNFYRAPSDGSPPVNYVSANGHKTNFGEDPQRVLIRDLRGHPAPALDIEGFQLVRPDGIGAGGLETAPESVLTSATAAIAAGAHDQDETDAAIRTVYYPEVEALLLASIPGANRIHIFDHTIRRAVPGAPRGPVAMVHIDQTLSSVQKRVRRHLPEDADELLRGRYRIINVWRPIGAAVESHPLAFATSSSVSDADILPVRHQYENGYAGETAAVKFNPAQEWWYLSGVTLEERILIECFDSEALKDGSQVKGGRTPHTAFEHPETAADARPRESIEVRALVFGP